MKKAFTISIIALATINLTAFDSVAGDDFKDISKCHKYIKTFVVDYGVKAHKAHGKFIKECTPKRCFSINGSFLPNGYCSQFKPF